MRHLILNLESPLMAFGGETIDNYGVIRRFPAASMLAGLFANALGWRRTERERHQRLQNRLIFAVRIDWEPHAGLRLTDFQTAHLGARDQGWTTRGEPEGRAGGDRTYDAPHLRYRDYFADMRVTVALRLQPDDEPPRLDDVAAALQEPARPLFIGRKSCLPSGPLFAGFREGATAVSTLRATPLDEPASAPDAVRLLWPEGETSADAIASRSYLLTDQRNWTSGLHGGGRPVCEGAVARDTFPTGTETPQ